MFNVRSGPRVFGDVYKASRTYKQRCQCRRLSGQAAGSASRLRRVQVIGLVLAAGAGTALFQRSRRFGLREIHAEAPVEMKIEKPKRKKGLPTEDNRDLISSQHLQVKRSWENPGVYAWGSNTGKVVAPDSNETLIKSPRRIPFFDGLLLRDIRLDRNFGAAITEKGDLLQWGTAYSPDVTQPTPTLKGKDLISVSLSRDRVLALSSSGKVYSLPVSATDQATGSKPPESSWLPFITTPSPISYRLLTPPSLSSSEKISTLTSGLDHALLLTTTGRLFSSAASSTDFPSKGQLGIPGLTWTSRPPGPYDQLHEISTLRGFHITYIATGDTHSLALDRAGRVFAFGDNSSGQLGLDTSPDAPFVDAPALLPLQNLYAGSGLTPLVTGIFAGGANSFFTVDATRTPALGEPQPSQQAKASERGLGRVTAETWACGLGIYGGLGNGRWTHVQGTPTKLKALSGLWEYDEARGVVVPIRLARLAVGSTHAAAVMANVTYVRAGSGVGAGEGGELDTNWGRMWCGGGERVGAVGDGQEE
ncbi:MAG: mitochondrial fmp25 [Lasallia pustulata]|uniref:Mitochondrial fmp25 n=1 Tax=Lasallia pustulata TaxID=136370 RepID=A0A5M8PI06_9LECA|nr:MAG: mitochondrial fmp25 [Lasallia pustulata]